MTDTKPDIVERLRNAPTCPANKANDYKMQARFFHEAADEIERLRAQTTWQSIETAPRDGTPVLVFGGRYISPSIAEADGEWWTSFHDKLSTIPTHWMPLPKPPNAKEKA